MPCPSRSALAPVLSRRQGLSLSRRTCTSRRRVARSDAECGRCSCRTSANRRGSTGHSHSRCARDAAEICGHWRSSPRERSGRPQLVRRALRVRRPTEEFPFGLRRALRCVAPVRRQPISQRCSRHRRPFPGRRRCVGRSRQGRLRSRMSRMSLISPKAPVSRRSLMVFATVSSVSGDSPELPRSGNFTEQNLEKLGDFLCVSTLVPQLPEWRSLCSRASPPRWAACCTRTHAVVAMRDRCPRYRPHAASA